MINLADLPAVRAKLARDAEGAPGNTAQFAEARAAGPEEPQPDSVGYPSKKLTLQPGGYYTVVSEKASS